MATVSHLFLPTHIHYLFFYTLSLILGIYWQAAYLPWFSAVLSIGVLMIISSVMRKARIQISNIIRLIIFFALGALAFTNSAEQFNRFATTYNRSVCDVRARVRDLVEVDNRRFNKIVTLEVYEIKKVESDDWQAASSYFKIYTRADFNAQPHEAIELHFLKISFPEQGDFRNYLIKEGISATLFPYKLDYIIVASPQNSLWSLLYATRKRIYESCKQKMSDVTFSLYSTIFLGNKNVDEDHLTHYKNQFQFWGISHYLARSGLHLVIFLCILQFFLSFIPISYTSKQIFMVGIVVLYAALSWSSISFTRSLYTIVLYQICNIVSIPISPLHLLSLITMGILLISPFQLFFLDFQLSFGLTCTLALLNVIIKQHALRA